MKTTVRNLCAILITICMLASCIPFAVFADNEPATPTDLAPVVEEALVESGTEEPAEEETDREEPAERQPGEEQPTGEQSGTEEPVGEEPIGEEEKGEGPAEEDLSGEKPVEEENSTKEPEEELSGGGTVGEETPGEEPEEGPQGKLPELRFGRNGYRGTLNAGEKFEIVMRPEYNRNILVTLSLTPKDRNIHDINGIQIWLNGEKKNIIQVENEGTDNVGIILQFSTYTVSDNEYIVSIISPFDAEFILTAENRQDSEPEYETNPVERSDDAKDIEEDEDTEDKEEAVEPDDSETIIVEPGETVEIHLWVSGIDDSIQIGDTVTLRANAETEMTGILTWQVRNEQIEDGKWRRIGYGDYVTIEIVKGDEYRFVMQDGSLSDVLQLNIAGEKEEQPSKETEGEEPALPEEITNSETDEKTDGIEDQDMEEQETTEEKEEDKDAGDITETEPAAEESTEKTDEQETTGGEPEATVEEGENEEMEHLTDVAQEETDGEPEKPESVEEEPENLDGENDDNSVEDLTAEETEAEQPTEEPEGETGELEETGSAEETEDEQKQARNIKVNVTWDVPDPIIGDTAHFSAILEGYEGLKYTVQWQYSLDQENWIDITDATDITMDVVVTEENNEVYWRILVFVEEEQEA